jgi:ATP-dependent Clp protease adapter protein ClpS
VVLHWANTHDLISVAKVVMELTHFGTAEAEFRMWEAYHRGRSLVLVTHLERAELFVEQFADRGLAASIEPE